jgi:hypothetical protein
MHPAQTCSRRHACPPPMQPPPPPHPAPPHLNRFTARSWCSTRTREKMKNMAGGQPVADTAYVGAKSTCEGWGGAVEGCAACQGGAPGPGHGPGTPPAHAGLYLPGNFTQACHQTNLPSARRGPDIPGDLFRRSRNRKKNGRPFVRWPELRPDKSGPAQTGPALPARSPTEAQCRSRPQRSTLQSVVVAGSRSSRAKSVQPAAVNLPRPIASAAQRGGRAPPAAVHCCT